MNVVFHGKNIKLRNIKKKRKKSNKKDNFCKLKLIFTIFVFPFPTNL